MANYDAGHYFLTVMAPLDRDKSVVEAGTRRSAIDHVRHVMALLPTAQQDAFSDHVARMSPFAAVPGTHFAHLFVIDDLRYNGRRPSNPILDLIFNTKMTIAQKADSLPCAYVVLAVDFDAIDGTPAALRAWTDDAWHFMGDTLRAVFGLCEGFDGVTGKESFFRFVKTNMVETTLPFNDYWTEDPPPRNPYGWMIATSLSVLACGAAALWWGGGLALIGAVTLVALLLVNLGVIAWYGLTPFPTAPDSDLESVLKALYIQQMFTGFVIENLGSSDAALAEAFDRFCEEHDPAARAGPTQPPGVLVSKWHAP